MEDLLLLSPFRIVSNEDGTLSALLRTAVVLLLLLRCQLHVSKHPWLNAADDDAEQLRCQMEQFCIECQEEYHQSLTSRGFTWTFPYAQDQHIYRGTAERARQVLEDFLCTVRKPNGKCSSVRMETHKSSALSTGKERAFDQQHK